MPNLGIEIKRKCEICGNIFVIKTLDSIYCSPKCSKIASKRKKDKEKKEARVKESERAAKRNELLNEASNKMAEVKKAREALSAAQKAYAETIKKINEFDIENKRTREINVSNYDSFLDFILDSIGDF